MIWETKWSLMFYLYICCLTNNLEYMYLQKYKLSIRGLKRIKTIKYFLISGTKNGF